MEKPEPPETEASGRVTDDQSTISAIATCDCDCNETGRLGRLHKYESVGGGTVYRICLLGTMYETLSALLGIIAIVSGMFAAVTCALSYNTTNNGDAGESDEDEVGTDIDNPEKSLSRYRRTANSADGGDGRRENVVEGSNDSSRAQRPLQSEGESSIDEFADAMESVQVSDRRFPITNDERVTSEEYTDTNQEPCEEQNRSLVDEALDDAFAILDMGGIDLVGGDESTEPSRKSNSTAEDELQPSKPNGNDNEVMLRTEDDKDIYVRHAREIVHSILENALRILDDETVREHNDVRTEEGNAERLNNDFSLPHRESEYSANTQSQISDMEAGKDQDPLMEEDIQIAAGHSEEATIPRANGAYDTDHNESGESTQDEDWNDVVTVTTSVKYNVVELHDVPNAPVIKNALDDETVDYGSDDTPTSSDADTVKDAGVDIAARELELVESEQIKDVVGPECNGDDIVHREGNQVTDTYAAKNANEDLPVNGTMKESDGERSYLEDAEYINDHHKHPMQNGFDQGCIDESAYDQHENKMNIPRIEIHVADEEDDDIVYESNIDECLPSGSSVACSAESETVLPEKDSINGHFEVVDSVPENDENQNQTKPDNRKTTDTSATNIDDESREKEPETIKSTPSDFVITAVEADNNVSSHVQSLMFNLTGEEGSIEGSDDGEHGKQVTDPRSDVIDFMIEVDACRSNDAVTLPATSEDKDVVNEDVIAPNFAKPVQCGNASTFFGMDSTGDVGRESTDAQFADGNIEISATVAVPSSDVRGLLKSLTGEDIPQDRDLESDIETDTDVNISIDDYIIEQPEQDQEALEHERPVGPFVEEDVVAPNVAKQVESTPVDLSLLPQTIPPPDSKHEQRLTAGRQDNISNKSTSRDFHEDITASKTISPSPNLKGLLSTSLGGSAYDDDSGALGCEEDVKEEVRIEDYILDIPVESEANDSSSNDHNDERFVHEDKYISASLPEKNQPEIDLSSILLVQRNSPSKDESNEVVVPVTVSEDKSKPNMDINDILSNVPEAPPSKVTIPRFFEDKVVPNDVRKADKGCVNLKKLLNGLNGEFTADVDGDESDVSQHSPGKKVITDEMVREAIQFLMQKPFLYSYGMYNSQDSLFFGYHAIIDESLYPGVSTFALVSTPEQGHFHPEEKSTLFALTGSPANDKHGINGSVRRPVIEDTIKPDQLDEKDSVIKFDELFAALDGSPVLEIPKDEVNRPLAEEETFQDTSVPFEEAVPEQLLPNRIPYPEVISSPDVDRWQPEVDEEQREDSSAPLEEELPVPELMIPDSIPYSDEDDDDSSSNSSSDTSGTYILDNDDVIEEDPRGYHQSLLKEAIPEEESSYPPVTSMYASQGPYHRYSDVNQPPPREEQLEELAEEEEPVEEEEKPKAGRVFFLTSAMLAELSKQQEQKSYDNEESEHPRQRSDSSSSDSSDSYLEEIPAGYGPNSGRVWPQPSNVDQSNNYQPDVSPEDYDSEDPLGFRPISGQDSSVDPNQEIALPIAATKAGSLEVMPKQPTNENPLSDYDSSSELIEIENQKQRMFPFYTDPQSSDWSQQNGYNAAYHPNEFLPKAEPNVKSTTCIPEELAPQRRHKDIFEAPKENTGTVPNISDLVSEPAIAKEFHMPDQSTTMAAKTTLDKMQSPELGGQEAKTTSENSYDPNKYVAYDPFSQSEGSALSTSDYQGYEGSSSDESETEGNDNVEANPSERLFAIVGAPSDQPQSAIRIVGSVEVYRNEDEIDVQQSLHTYEISKGIAGPDGSITQLKEQSFTFEQRTDISEITCHSGTITRIQEHHEQSFSYEETTDVVEVQSLGINKGLVSPEDAFADLLGNSVVHESNERSDPGKVMSDENEPVYTTFTKEPSHGPSEPLEEYGSLPHPMNNDMPDGGDSAEEDHSGLAYGIGCYPAASLSNAERQFESRGEEVPSRDDFQQQVNFLSDLLTEKTLEMQRFKNDYPWLDRLIANPKEKEPNLTESDVIGFIAVYKQLEEEVLDLMNAYEEAKNQLSYFDNFAKR